MDKETLHAIAKMMESKLEEHTRRIEIAIENDVTKRIDALFDGYKLTHEKQYELERKVASLERRLEQLENRID